MTTTAVLSEDSATIVRDDVNRFNWSAAIVGAVIATAVTFFLVTLGSGVGLALFSVPNASATGLKAFLTLGATYFFAAEAFGFAVGGHIAGRLIGPAAENTKEEEFRAGAHGLAVWAIVIVAGLAVAAFAVTVGGSAVAGGAAANANKAQAAPVSYWADILLSPATPVSAPTLANDKAEAGRILTVDLVRGANINSENRSELARLVMQDAGLSNAGAVERVNANETQMQDEALQVAESTRKAASFVSIWTALALLFGAVVSVAAAISARWEDDRITFGWTRRQPRT
jgi:hypothetical protein